MNWRLRKKNKRTGTKKGFPPKKVYLVFLALIFLLAAMLIIQSGIFTVQKIRIRLENLNCADDKQIKDLLNLSGENFFLINPKKLEEILKNKFICIDKLSLSKQIPDKVNLRVFGRIPSAVLISLSPKEATESVQLQIENIATPSAEIFSGGEKFLVDEEGIVFAKSIENLVLPAFFLYDGEILIGKKIEGDTVNKTLTIINKLKTLGMKAGNVSILNNKFLIIHTLPKIIFKLPDKIDIQLASLQLILEKAKIESNNLEFIDLRFDKPVVQFAPKKK